MKPTQKEKLPIRIKKKNINKLSLGKYVERKCETCPKKIKVPLYHVGPLKRFCEKCAEKRKTKKGRANNGRMFW